MKGEINKKGNAEEILKEDAFWEDPMCYPTYDKTSVLGRHGAVCGERDKEATEISADRVAA